MTPLIVTAITNFLLASEVFFLAGMLAQGPKEAFSAAWFWTATLIGLGLGALVAGIDHGFYEAYNRPRRHIQVASWVILGATTFCMLMTTAAQFFPGAFWVFLAVGVVQFAVYTALVLRTDSFLVVILNYAPVAVFLIVMNFIGLPAGTGSVWLIAGMLILFAASAVQALGVDTFSPLDRNGLYHVIAMVGVIVLHPGAAILSALFGG